MPTRQTQKVHFIIAIKAVIAISPAGMVGGPLFLGLGLLLRPLAGRDVETERGTTRGEGGHSPHRVVGSLRALTREEEGEGAPPHPVRHLRGRGGAGRAHLTHSLNDNLGGGEAYRRLFCSLGDLERISIVKLQPQAAGGEGRVRAACRAVGREGAIESNQERHTLPR